MDSYFYTTSYKYTCPECEKSETKNEKPHSCIKCGIELCDECFKKHHKLCIWCYDKISDEYLWKRKLSTYLMVIIPLIVFLLPAPVPIIILLILSYNVGLLLITLLFIGISISVCFILRIYYTRKMIETIQTEKTFK